MISAISIPESILLPLAAFMIASLSALWLHPYVTKIAKLKEITDKPDKRKLQREPVPVLGGVVVFFGIMLGFGMTSPFYEVSGPMFLFMLMLLMLYIGVMDDIMGLTPRLRLIIEILASLAAIYVGGYGIDSFHGLWGIGKISSWIGVPLTVLTVVGIINAVNLIDGVNGLSSGYCIMACVIFGIYFAPGGDKMMTILCVSCVGALIPFFVFNVFGNKDRMFIGDGGTLMIGMMLSLSVLQVLGCKPVHPSVATDGREFGLIPFTLSVLSIPVFDTLRVMTMRMLRGVSPFHPDKTHLHHAFIDLGFSHIRTTLSILCLNLLIVGTDLLLYRLGASADCQFYVVIILSLLFTAGMYLLLRHIYRRK